MSTARISLTNGASHIDPSSMDWDAAMAVCEEKPSIALLDEEVSNKVHGEPDPREWLRLYATAYKAKHGAWPVLR